MDPIEFHSIRGKMKVNQLFDYGRPSKYLLLCSAEERNSYVDQPD